jgi:hypothetical protein
MRSCSLKMRRCSGSSQSCGVPGHCGANRPGLALLVAMQSVSYSVRSIRSLDTESFKDLQYAAGAFSRFSPFTTPIISREADLVIAGRSALPHCGEKSGAGRTDWYCICLAPEAMLRIERHGSIMARHEKQYLGESSIFQYRRARRVCRRLDHVSDTYRGATESERLIR